MTADKMKEKRIPAGHSEIHPAAQDKRKWKRKQQRVTEIGVLFVIPVAFVLLTCGLLYIALKPLQPYFGVLMMFVSDEPVSGEAPAARNLFAEAALSESTESPPEDIDEPEVPAFLKRSELDLPRPGDLYGNITISGTAVDAPVYYGDSEQELVRGVGTYTGGWLPGFGRTIMLAGHRNTDFRDLGSAETGEIITVQTHYGTYTYEITETAVFHMNDPNAYDFTLEEENIIIYTCYPFDYIGAAQERFFVYGKPLTGTPVDRFS